MTDALDKRRSPHERSDMRDCGTRTCASLIEVIPHIAALMRATLAKTA
jgi:hypothetical protein